MTSDPAPVLRAQDPETGLTGLLDVLPGADGGVAAARLEVRNDADHDLTLRYHEDPRVTVTVAVTDRAGVPLNSAPPLPDSSSGGRLLERTLSPGTALHWLVPISDRMAGGTLPPERRPGRLFVTVALDVATGDATDPVTVILTMYDPLVEFTRGSADEGNAWGQATQP
jgi:hypothetical protein